MTSSRRASAGPCVALALLAASAWLGAGSGGVRGGVTGVTAATGATVWDAAEPPRPGAGGLEAERDTWVRARRSLDVAADRGGQSWTVHVGGDARPTMKRMTIEAVEGTIDSPFVLSDKSYDFRSAARLVASVTRGTKTDEARALALRELLIGEGFYFHFKPPPMMDPIHRLTNAGYGFCGQHAQIFEELAHIAGLRVSTCSHSFGYGHATNQVFYDGQWHFLDSNGESFFRRPDGVIPSYDEIRRTPDLVPSGDAYGQTSFGVDGSRYARALYAAPDTTCIERTPSRDTAYGALRYTLRGGDRITWEWEDASYSLNRQNRLPLFGRGTVSTRLQPADFTLGGGRAQRRIALAYPPLQVTLTARLDAERAPRATDGVSVRVSKDKGKTWLELKPVASSSVGASVSWQATIADPDAWQDPSERHATTADQRMVVAGQYGYLLDITLPRDGGQATVLRDLRLDTVFRQYPPALPILVAGANQVTYVDEGGTPSKVRVTLDWIERTRPPGLGTQAEAWRWGDTIGLAGASSGGSSSGASAALPTFTSDPDGALHLVYATGPFGARRVGLRTYRSGAWSAETLMTPAHQDASHPVAAVDATGTLWIAYQVGGFWQGADVWAVPTRDGRSTDPIRMNTTDPYHVAFFPSITASAARVSVAWEGGQIDKDETNAWGTEVGWLRTFDGRAWSEPAIIRGEPFINLGLPKVFYDARGRLHLTGTKGPRYYRTLAPTRAPFQWLSPEWVYHSRGGGFSADGRGNVWAAFDGQGSGTTNEIYARMLSAAAADTAITGWTRAIRISEDDKRPSIYPDLAATDPSRVSVTWMDYRHGDAEIYAKVFEQGRWSPDLLLSPAADAAAARAAASLTPNELLTRPARGRHAGYPRIASAGDGTTWVVWEESIDGVPRTVRARSRRAH